MKIKLGPNVNAKGGFKVLTSDGRDITKELHVTFLSIDASAQTGKTSVFMEVNPDSVEAFAADDLVEVIVTDESPQYGWRRLVWKLSRLRVHWLWPRLSW